MKYAVYTLTAREYGMEELAPRLAAYGYDGVEWRIHPEGDIKLDELEEKAELVRGLAQAHGLEIASLATYLPLDDLGGIERLFRAAQAMGCLRARVYVPRYDPQIGYHRQFQEAVENLAKIEKLAGHYGVKALLETHHGNIACSASLAHRLVKDFDPECIGVLFDPGNMVFEGFEAWQMGLELLGEHLGYVHVKNSAWRREGQVWRREWVPMPEGQVNWREVMAALKAVGYNGWLSFEDFSPLPSEDKLRDNIAYLKGMEQD